jgi:hypothetical protein
MVTLAVAAFERRRGLWLMPPAFCFGPTATAATSRAGRLRAITWGEAADFLIDHKLTGRLFNA